uniref:Uncharacterized protein n=1 Tax=Sphaerodactylus townsendi TaxID=933632 RepID=A0ACB8GBG0_9SAUR
MEALMERQQEKSRRGSLAAKLGAFLLTSDLGGVLWSSGGNHAVRFPSTSQVRGMGKKRSLAECTGL